MEIFQKSVVNNHLINLDKEQVDKAFNKFKENYSPAKISEIRKLKEEEYQDGFLREIFVDIFGYTLKPADNYDLAREFKNQSDGKKADGAILKDGKAIVVIELKSTKTKDLTSITEQAFNYKNNQPDCKYVITSNFRKLRFYIDYSNEYEEFDLFNLQKQEFELLYLILHKDSIFSDLPLKLKTETKFHEENISDKLYKDYSNFKHKIYNNLIKNNPQYDKLTLFKKSQKFLDRLLFVFFAEDTGLVPPNAISKIVEQWEALQELDEYKTLYSRFVKFFEHLDKGHKYKTYELPAYNGGLFAPDEILDHIRIDDEILKDDALKLSAYDFNTDVDVNILGHIFEHSLNEIEEITAEISASMGHAPLASSKRKKDGVFYTPKYITQYIVENTVGKLCSEKREELNIKEIEFDGTFKTKDGKLSAKGKKLFKTLNNYKKWMLSLKIIDPACGSGAFLNQALIFLIEQHKQIDDIIAELTGEAMRLFDTDKAILENNLYGVDINEESVEIAKLSLWLRTAQKGRKLSNLNSNIKCGNSLIDDPTIAGDKAFDWNKEFPKIFTEKKKKVWHITTATHNSRYSQRMFDNHVKTEKAIWLDEQDEIIITRTIADIVKKDNLNVIEYNICGDHLHLLLVCEKEELSGIVGKLKAISGRKYNIEKGITIVPATSITRGHAPLSDTDTDIEGKKEKKKYNSLWTQKFGKSEIKDENYLNNAIEYIRNNRVKHELPKSKEIEKIKKEFLCTVEHAFKTEYNGGFDCVIGNPPYVRQELIKQYSVFLSKNYVTYSGKADLFVFFYEKGVNILKQNGLLSFISSGKFFEASYGFPLVNYLTNKTQIKEILDFKDLNVFDGISAYPLILTIKNIISQEYIFGYQDVTKIKFNNLEEIFSKLDLNKININDFIKNDYQFIDIKIANLIRKLSIKSKYLSDLKLLPLVGVKTGFNDGYTINNNKDNKHIRKYVFGRNVKKYGSIQSEIDIVFPYKFENNEYLLIDIEKETSVFGLLNKNKVRLEQRAIIKDGIENNTKLWFEYQQINRMLDFDKEYIIYPNVSLGNNFTLSKGSIIDMTCFIISSNSKFLLAILNSNTTKFLMEIYAISRRGGYLEYKTQYLKKIPIPQIQENAQQPFIEKADKMLDLNKILQEKKSKFIKRIKDNLGATAPDNGASPIDLKLSKKLETFYDYDFKTFVSELKKKKIKLSLVQQDEWEEYFKAYKTEINQLQSQINQTDKEIDQMVYKLYELTEEEIKIVEESVK